MKNDKDEVVVLDDEALDMDKIYPPQKDNKDK
jgi:hypothetical protein